MSIKIDSRSNGIHSLAEAVKAFKNFNDKPDDVYAVKDIIIRSHHGLETLFKDILFKINPVLVLDKDVKILNVFSGYKFYYENGGGTVIDEQRTISLGESIKRIYELKLLRGVDEREYQNFINSITRLVDFRNKLQHLSIDVDSDVVGRVIGNVLPRAITIIDETYRYVSWTHLDLAIPTTPMRNEIMKLYPEAESILQLMSTKYDELIKEALEYFTGKIFPNMDLTLKVRDHGNVGAPPYFPNLKSDGFIIFEADQFRYDGIPYNASLNISYPEFTNDAGSADYGRVEGSILLDATLILDGSKSLKLPDSEKQTSVLKSIGLKIKVTLDYNAIAFKSSWHLTYEEITHVSGQIVVTMEILPFGAELNKEMIIAEYISPLDESNTQFRMHAFLNPDGTLQDNHYLELIINAKNKLEFKVLT